MRKRRGQTSTGEVRWPAAASIGPRSIFRLFPRKRESRQSGRGHKSALSRGYADHGPPSAIVWQPATALTRRGAFAYKPRQLRAGRPDRRGWLLCVRLSCAFGILEIERACENGRAAENSGEEDLSAEQTGAQAAPWLSHPHGDPWWPQGFGRSSRTRAQAAERVIGDLAMGAIGAPAKSTAKSPSAVRKQAFRHAVAKAGAVERLKRRSEFRAAATGLRASASCFALQALARSDDRPPRVGFTVSKQVGNAVERNRVRRRLREVVRLSAAEGEPKTETGLRPGHDYVLIGRRAALAAPFGEMMREFDTALRRVHKSEAAGTGGARRGPPHETGSDARSPTRPRPQR
jgi:ribonuclease P protein component